MAVLTVWLVILKGLDGNSFFLKFVTSILFNFIFYHAHHDCNSQGYWSNSGHLWLRPFLISLLNFRPLIILKIHYPVAFGLENPQKNLDKLHCNCITVMDDWESSKPRLCGKFTLFKTRLGTLKVLNCCFLSSVLKSMTWDFQMSY